jgi:hypothetical protein
MYIASPERVAVKLQNNAMSTNAESYVDFGLVVEEEPVVSAGDNVSATGSGACRVERKAQAIETLTLPPRPLFCLQVAQEMVQIGWLQVDVLHEGR